MRTTIELPDALFREVKAKTGRDGVTLKEFFTEAVKDKLRAKPESGPERKRVKLPIFSKDEIPLFPSLTNSQIEDIFNAEDIERYKLLAGPRD